MDAHISWLVITHSHQAARPNRSINSFKTTLSDTAIGLIFEILLQCRRMHFQSLNNVHQLMETRKYDIGIVMLKKNLPSLLICLQFVCAIVVKNQSFKLESLTSIRTPAGTGDGLELCYSFRTSLCSRSCRQEIRSENENQEAIDDDADNCRNKYALRTLLANSEQGDEA